MSDPIKGGHLLVQCLANLGATKGFGVPGESYLPVLDAFYEQQHRFNFICCRNEGGAAFMSVAHAKLSGAPGICFVTRGPGATNASIGVHTAMQDSVPMLLFVGQVGTNMKYREAFQELNYESYFGSLTKWVAEIPSVDRIPELVSRAWSTALSGRPGPVVLALPEEVLSDSTTTPACKPLQIPEPAPSEKLLGEAQQLLANSKRPLVIVGGQGWNDHGRRDLDLFLRNNKLPTLAAFRFQDLVDHHCDYYVGDAGVGMNADTQQLIKQADLIIAINIRFGEMTTAGYSLMDIPNPQMKLIHCHAGDSELGKVYAADLAVHAGPNEMLAALKSINTAPAWSEWARRARVGYLKNLKLPPQPGTVDMGVIISWLQANAADDAIFTNGAGNFAIWLNRFFQFGKKQTLLAPQSGAMGFGVPAAIAAKHLYPNRQVICFAGDGDFQMNGQELGTAMQNNCQPIILIINNGTYGTIRMHQERHFPNRVSGTELQNPDFVALAKAYGFYSQRVTETATFPEIFAQAVASATGAVIDIQIDIESLTPKQSLGSIRQTAMATGQ